MRYAFWATVHLTVDTVDMWIYLVLISPVVEIYEQPMQHYLLVQARTSKVGSPKEASRAPLLYQLRKHQLL